MATIETLGKYEIRRVLGRGSAGTVLEGWDPAIRRRVAIKTVRIVDATDPDIEEQIGRFRREAQAAGRLIHPSIVTVHDYGETEEVAYIVMEFVEGPSLRTFLDKRQPASLEDTVRIMEDVLAGLEFSHERGIVHRDIKPANVMLTSHDMGRARAKIADFGIARIESSVLTQAGTIVGTPAYMSPEQFMGETINARSDIYGAGILLYQLLTGERPFDGTISAVMHKVLSTEAPAPSAMSVHVPPAFDAVVRRAIAKRPEQRFASAAAFSTALRAALASSQRVEGSASTPPADLTVREAAPVRPAAPPPEPPAVVTERSRLPLLVSALALILVAGVGVSVFWVTPRNGLGVGAEIPARAVATSPPAPAPRLPGADPAPAVRPAEARARLVRMLDGLRCALVHGTMENPRAARLGGIAGTGTESVVRAELAAQEIPIGLAWTVTPAGREFCPVLDTLRPIVPGFASEDPRLTLKLADDRTSLRDGDAIRPRVIMPPFPAYLYVDYIARDGTVQHLYPQIADPENGIAGDRERAYAPSEWVNLGDPQPGQRGWEASEPFGTDMIIAIAASRPLFDKPRPANAEPAWEYLRALDTAIQALRQAQGEASAGATTIEVAPR